MKSLVAVITVCFCLVGTALAQRTGLDWMTDNADPARSSWIRSDGKIKKETMEKSGFQFLWKTKVKNTPKQLNNLTAPTTLDRLIGYRGFRMLGFFAGSGDNLITYDTDLGRLEWEKALKVAPSTAPSTLACPGGMTTTVARPALFTIPPAPGASAAMGGGRNTPAKSGVGEPGQGAVTLANVRPNPPGGGGPPTPTPANPAQAPRPRVNTANPAGGQLGAGPFLVYALASDGMLHALHLSNGADYQPPAKFVPPNAMAAGLLVSDQYAYVTTQNGCNGAANGVWAMDLENKTVKSFNANVVGSVGAAFDADGTIYVATGSGGDKANSLVALDHKTLAVKASFAAGTAFSSSPVVFSHKGKSVIAAATQDGRVHLFDSADLSKPLASSMATVKAADFAPGALASWQDPDGTRWILAAASNTQATDAGFNPTNGALTKGAVVAWKVVEANGVVTLQPGWASRNLVAPLTPTIINGVAFVTSSGEFQTKDSKVTAAQRAMRSGRAVLYALDAMTGKELWNSGTTITSFARSGALSGGMGQIYLTTYDGTIYTFGFPMEH